MVADKLSRFVYPASEADRDIYKHGSAQDDDEIEASFCESVWRRVVCTFVLARRVMWRRFPGGFKERWQCHTPPSQGVGAVRSTVGPPWQFESSLSQISVPGLSVLTVGSGLGCDVDSQFHQVSSSELTCRNPSSEVLAVVFKTGSKSACMNTTSEVTSAVSVVHRLSEDISDSVRTLVGMVMLTP